MASFLAKGVAMGPLLSGGSNPLQDLDPNNDGMPPNANIYGYQQTGTAWCRLWIDWPSAQPTRDSFDLNYFAVIDRQIKAAKSKGLAVMLTSYRFPRWVNGTDGQDPTSYKIAERKSKADPVAQAKQLEFGFPLMSEITYNGAYGFWIYVLASRYNPGSKPLGPTTYIDALEVVNEPNLQCWPQRGPSVTSDAYEAAGSSTYAHVPTAHMLFTARQVTALYTSNQPLIVGPATNDIVGNSRQRSDYGEFTVNVLNEMRNIGYLGDPGLAWSQHNYGDVTYDLGPDSTSQLSGQYPVINRAANTRTNLINSGWQGWPAANNPYILLTEGGVTRQKLTDIYGIDPGDQARLDAAQGNLLLRAYNRLKNDSLGAGIGLFTNYTWYGDTNAVYDSGLYGPTGGFRASFDYWKCLGSRADW